MRQIWKFGITMADHQTLQMPKSAQILTVKVQGGEVFLWALVIKPSEKSHVAQHEERRVRVVCTGEDCDDVADYQYVGTVLLRMDTLVFHVFVESSKTPPSFLGRIETTRGRKR